MPARAHCAQGHAPHPGVVQVYPLRMIHCSSGANGELGGRAQTRPPSEVDCLRWVPGAPRRTAWGGGSGLCAGAVHLAAAPGCLPPVCVPAAPPVDLQSKTSSLFSSILLLRAAMS